MNPTDRPIEQDSPCCPAGNCGIARRDFIKTLTVGAAAAAGSAMPVMAGPFEAAEQEKLVPADKKLDPAVGQVALRPRGRAKSIAARTWRRSACRSAGSVPASSTWAATASSGTGTSSTSPWAPATITTPIRRCPSSPLEQGFAVEIAVRRPQGKCGRLDHRGFPDVAFCGEYPIGLRRVPRSAVARRRVAGGVLALHPAWMREDSSLPATVMRFTVKNTERQARSTCELAGWLENAVGLYTAPRRCGQQRRNRVLRQAGRCWSIHSDIVAERGESARRRHRLRRLPEGDLRRLDRRRARPSARGRS